MEIEDLNYHINTVLDKEMNDLKKKKGTISSDISQKNKIKYPNAETLIGLYSIVQSNDLLKKHFIDTLLIYVVCNPEKRMHAILNDQLYATVSKLSFYTLIKIGFGDDALSHVSNRTISSNAILISINYLLQEETDNFTSKQYDMLKKCIEKMILEPHIQQIRDRLPDVIINKKFNILKSQIQQTNIEINRDKKVLMEKMNVLNFNNKYNVFLKELDELNKDKTLDIINSGMIANFRSFIQDIMKEIAKKIVEKTKDPIPEDKDKSEMGRIRSYLKNKLELTETDDKFIDSFVNILHKEGGHSFTSTYDYFRLTRNIGIEIVLLLISKYEIKFEPSTKTDKI